MKTYLEILRNKDDGGIALELHEQGYPEVLWQAKFGDSQLSIGWIIQNLMRLEGQFVQNGFFSIFDQFLAPWEIADHEKFMALIGADEFLKYFAQCRELYFGDRPLPQNSEEWEAFESIYWTDPDSNESEQFDILSDMAEKAYYGDETPGEGYYYMHKKVGAYLRENLSALMSTQDQQG